MGDYDRAETALRRSLELSQRLGDGHGVPESLASLANIYSARGQYSESLAMLHEAISSLREQGDTLDLGAALSNLGTTLAELGRFEEAQAALEEALATLRASQRDRPQSSQAAIAQSLNNLGRLHFATRQWLEAKRVFEEAAVIYRQLGDTPETANTLSNMATIALQEGDFARGLQLSEEALALRRSLGDHVGSAYASPKSAMLMRL